MKTETRDPQDLKRRFSPALKHIPQLDEPALECLRASINSTGGVIEPVVLDAEERVATDHGRSVVLAACVLGLEAVPVQMTNLCAEALIVSDLAGRRHLSKGARAYLSCPFFDLAAADRKRAGWKIAKNPNVLTADSVRSGRELARHLGYDEKLIRQSLEVREYFTDPKLYKFTQVGGPRDGAVVRMTLKDYFEPKLLRQFVGGEHEQNRPIGLGGIIRECILLQKGKTGIDEPRPEQADFIGKLFAPLLFRVSNWQGLSERDQGRVIKCVKDVLDRLPPDALEWIDATIERRRRQENGDA